MFKQKITVLDGAMGTMLQQAGLKLGERPELLCLSSPELVEQIHREYVKAGADMVLTNTFCANARKLAGTGYSPEQIIRAAVEAAKRSGAAVALDIGPIGELLEPLGVLSFDEAYALFAQMIRAGADAGTDAVFFETFSDLNELRAGVLAAKECSGLPVFVSMTFEASGRTFLGCTPEAAAMTLDGLGVDALGINCSLGPKEAVSILRSMRAYTSLPLIFKPNAGLPNPETGRYEVQPETFAKACAPLADIGAAYIGGCCGTTPEFIGAVKKELADKEAVWSEKTIHGVCSSRKVCPFGQGIRVVGECINPTGKKQLAQALREFNMQPVVSLAMEQQNADILDINVGLADINEAEAMRRAVLAVSSVVDLPIQIDSADPKVIEAGLRIAPGKCLINSVNASDRSLNDILPLAKKYGAAVVGLTLDEHGLPETSSQRVEFAKKILNAAEKEGIPREEVVMDCLTLTVAAQPRQARETLDAVHRVRHELGTETMLGVSNISFGLPERSAVTRTFLAQAISAGLTMPIVNPSDMLDTVAACRVLSGEDPNCLAYIEHHTQRVSHSEATNGAEISVEEAIERGLQGEAEESAKKLLHSMAPLEIVEERLIPALNRVGEAYENGTIFLPQLMNASSAASAVFDVIRLHMQKSGTDTQRKGPIVLATVEGDIHDIGKNIVKTILESYGFRIIDLGRNVSPERIIDAVKQFDAKLVGLSALMTTTIPSMARCISCLRQAGLSIPVMVGGAVLTEECAKEIGADGYAKDAMQSVELARLFVP